MKLISHFFISIMNSSLGFTEIEGTTPNIRQERSKTEGSRTKKNITYKRRGTDKTENFLNSMQKEYLPDRPKAEEDDDEIGEPWQSPEMNIIKQNAPAPAREEEEPMLREGMEQQKKYYQEQQKQYDNKYVPTYTGTAQNIPYYSDLANSQDISGPKDTLMKKLNYVVHMLEEQQDQKTGSVGEEMVLYMFLGVFVIFVVDSFSKTGRYRRS
jgi:hypothetical protein